MIRNIVLAAAGGRLGTSWTSRTMASSSNWNAVAWANGTFVAISSTIGTIAATSPDGVTWTARTLPTTATWLSVAYGAGLFVAMSLSTAYATSSDGVTWTARTMPGVADQFFETLIFANNLFVAVTNAATSGTIYTSPDAITWTSRYSTGLYLMGIAWSGSLFVVGQDNSLTSGAYLTSPDGTTWTSRTDATNLAGYYPGVVGYGGGLFVIGTIFGSSTGYATSSNGTTWTKRTLPVSTNITQIIYVNGLFVATCGATHDNTGTSYAYCLTSPDGITWTQRTMPSAQWSGVASNGGRLVAVAYGTSTAATSP